VTPGPEFILESTAHPKFREILQRSDLSIPDGIGLKLGSLLRGPRIHHRITGVDYVHQLMRVADREGYRVFFLGAAHGVAEQAFIRFHETFPNLQLAGTEILRRGPWGRISNQRIAERIRRSRADILLVALGFPRQELWIDQHRDQLGSVKLAVGVGRTFDYVAGTIRRPPRLLRILGFEWLATWFGASHHFQAKQRRKRVWNAVWHYPWTLILK
jgi:N-acetylglucosaminyldiphosphoundecaprenol N-acetyl-beta-D-mannosaminyltransferase